MKNGGTCEVPVSGLTSSGAIQLTTSLEKKKKEKKKEI